MSINDVAATMQRHGSPPCSVAGNTTWQQSLPEEAVARAHVNDEGCVEGGVARYRRSSFRVCNGEDCGDHNDYDEGLEPSHRLTTLMAGKGAWLRGN